MPESDTKGPASEAEIRSAVALILRFATEYCHPDRGHENLEFWNQLAFKIIEAANAIKKVPVVERKRYATVRLEEVWHRTLIAKLYHLLQQVNDDQRSTEQANIALPDVPGLISKILVDGRAVKSSADVQRHIDGLMNPPGEEGAASFKEWMTSVGGPKEATQAVLRMIGLHPKKIRLIENAPELSGAEIWSAGGVGLDPEFDFVLDVMGILPELRPYLERAFEQFDADVVEEYLQESQQRPLSSFEPSSG